MGNQYINSFGNKIIFKNMEFKERLKIIKDEMDKKKIDILLIASPANQFYVTGYDGWSFYTPQIVIISINKDQPIWVGRAMDSVGAKFTSYLKKENIVPYPDKYVASKDRHPINYLSKIIKKNKWEKKRIGVEMDDYYYTAKWHSILKKELPNAKFVDAFLLVNWIRMIKSTKEIEYE